MAISNEIVLRPRFKIEINHANALVLEVFENAGTANLNYKIVRVDDHVFIRLPQHRQQFWSPQLHLEINANERQTATLRGLFGPNPTVWTMFMFLHFVVAGLFIAFGIWAYSNWALSKTYHLALGLMLAMVGVWFLLYFAGRFGRRKGKSEMLALYGFMESLLKHNNLL